MYKPDIDVTGHNISSFLCIETAGDERKTMSGYTVEDLKSIASRSNPNILTCGMLHGGAIQNAD